MSSAMTSQYLQVPKILPHRKSRSRSKSRPREVGSPTEVVFSPAAKVLRPQTPPLPAAELPPPPPPPAASHVKPTSTLNGFATGYRMPDHPTKPYTNGHTSNGLPYTITNNHHKPEDSTGTNYDDLNEDMYTLEQCRTPPPAVPLRQKLVGAWKLESYIAYPSPESPVQRPTFPMTKNVTGFIMYTPDGYMSAQMLIPGQQSFKRGEGEEPQWAEAGKRFFAYCGPYYITHEGVGREETLRHTFQVCNLPGWIGDIQIRTHRFEEDGQVLVLGSEEPTEIKGDKRIPVLKWRRARDNLEGVPPPPTPQIKISGPGEP